MQRHGVYRVKIFAGNTLLVEMPNFISLCTIPLCFAQRLKTPVLSCQHRVQTRSLNFLFILLWFPHLACPTSQGNEKSRGWPGSSRPLTYHREPAFRISNGLFQFLETHLQLSTVCILVEKRQWWLRPVAHLLEYKWLLNEFPLRYIST